MPGASDFLAYEPVCTGVLDPMSSSYLVPSSSVAMAESLGESSPYCDRSVLASPTRRVALSVLMRTIRLVNDDLLAGSPLPAITQVSPCFWICTDLSAWCSSKVVTFESSNEKIWGC